MPLPREEATPPVTKMCFVTGSHPIPPRGHFRRPRRSSSRRTGVRAMTAENETRSLRTLSTTTTDERGDADREAARQDHAEADGRTDRVGAGVTEHQLLAEVEDEEAGRRAEHHRDPRRRVREVRRQQHTAEHQGDLGGPARGPVEQVAHVGGAGDQQRVDREPHRAVDVDRPGHGHRDGERRRAA